MPFLLTYLRRCIVSAALLISSITSWAVADELRVYPASLSLHHAGDQQAVIAQWMTDDHVSRDVTDLATFQIADEGIARLSDARVQPVSDGETELAMEYEGQRRLIPIRVDGATKSQSIGFQRDVMPILTHAGCNTGTCHGSARGQDGFRLSLFGFDPRGDYFRITREMPERRIHLAVPEASLIMEKACGRVPHTGGQRLHPDDLHGQMLLNWLQQGATWDEGATRVTRIHLFPEEIVWSGAKQSQRLLVVADYSDGTRRDVTDLAVIRTNNESVARVSDPGIVQAGEPGEAFVTARFDVHTVGIPACVIRLVDDFQPLSDESNPIDKLVNDKLHTLRFNPGPLCSDSVFVRRVYLDTIGLLPTPGEIDAFLADSSPDKRARLVDELLQRPAFAELCAAEWADLLMVRERPVYVSRKSMFRFREWLRQQFTQNVPLDQLVRDLLTVTGSTFEEPAAVFFVSEMDRNKFAENVAQLFLGIRLQCAQCHNHPFDRWTMDDYYGFASFFTGVYAKSNEDYREWSVWAGGANAVNPVTGVAAEPRFLGNETAESLSGDRRPALSKWLVSPDNPYFARAMANRVWGHYMGRGIVEPVDDVRISNPPVNEPLYDYLARRLIECRYDQRELAREIMQSHTYQRAAAQPDDVADERNYSHAAVRRIPATVLLDCISQVTDSPEKYTGLPLGARAIQTWDHAPENYFLTTFGRSQRASVCACETRDEPTLSQALHLLNGAAVQNKIEQGGLIPRLLEQGKSPSEIIDELYLRCLTRRPSDTERNELLVAIESAPSPTEGLCDVFWAILNSREFLFVQ